MLLTSRMKDLHHDRHSARRTLGRPCARSAFVMLLLVGGVAIGAASLSLAPPALTAREARDDGYVWCPVGDPGNPVFRGLEGGPVALLTWRQFAGRGGVSYDYQISQTEVRVRQYLEFVQVYWPYFEGDPRSFDLTGDFIFAVRQGSGYIYEIVPGWEDAPANMSMRLAARFCNWMHNGNVNEHWAFEQGVYDASTFTQNPDRTYNDDYTRAPGARYWIPSLDEWLKAVYYDPTRHGAGEGGWWRYPNASDEPLKVGFPQEGGQTNGSLWDWYDGPRLPVGMYPSIQTPWGLLDASGGFAEVTQDGYGMGSSFFDLGPLHVSLNDLAGNYSQRPSLHPDWVSGSGLRMARMTRGVRAHGLQGGQ